MNASSLRLAVALGVCSVGSPALADRPPAIAIPPGNVATLRSPAPRPPAGDVETRARALAQAIAGAEPTTADEMFLPREPFLAIKDMSSAAQYFAQLVRWYHADIEQYRAQLPHGTTASFVRFLPARTCRWIEPGGEANRLPYWSCYGARLVMRANETEVTFRIHVMINWGDHWYVTHLGPIHRPASPRP